MNSRERVLAAINHREPDRVLFDLGGTVVTGIQALDAWFPGCLKDEYCFLGIVSSKENIVGRLPNVC